VTPLINKVQETIARHHMLTPEDRVLVGVSGGADSTALFLALRELGYDITVAHLNHGLRSAESDEDARFVVDLAGEFNVPCFVHAVSIPTQSGNVEAAGRAARKQFFKSLMQEHGYTKLALAHNREDRVETFLLNLMRGAGTEGLVSMSPVSGHIVRPLVETGRQEIEGFLTSRGRTWRTDRTNADLSFARNRMRHEVVPLLASLFNVRLPETLSRTLVILEDEDRWMRDLTKAWLDEHSDEGGIYAEAMRRLPAGLSRRLIREGLRRYGSDLQNSTFEQVEAVRGLLEEGKSGKTVLLPGGVVAGREFDRLVFTSAAEPPEFLYDLPIPGQIRIPELGRVIQARCIADLEAEPTCPGPERVFVDGSRLGPYVKIRNWRPGDYYRPAGSSGGKVKKLFQKARVPRSQRRRLPIFETDSTIIWVTSFPVSREFVPKGCSQKIVAFETLGG
jgi:tRNA(Ile)-lysidine synthase